MFCQNSIYLWIKHTAATLARGNNSGFIRWCVAWNVTRQKINSPATTYRTWRQAHVPALSVPARHCTCTLTKETSESRCPQNYDRHTRRKHTQKYTYRKWFHRIKCKCIADNRTINNKGVEVSGLENEGSNRTEKQTGPGEKLLSSWNSCPDLTCCCWLLFVAVITRPRKCMFLSILTFSTQIAVLCILHIMTIRHHDNWIVITIIL